MIIVAIVLSRNCHAVDCLVVRAVSHTGGPENDSVITLVILSLNIKSTYSIYRSG